MALEKVIDFVESQSDQERLSYYGRARLSPRSPVEAGSRGRWTLTFTVGTYGIDDGGGFKFLFSQPSDWGIPQFTDADAAEFATIESTGTAVLFARWATKIHERPWGKGIIIDVKDGALAPGDVVTLTLGASTDPTKRSRAQTYTEDPMTVRVFVDPFATVRYHEVSGDLALSVRASEPARMEVLATSEVEAAAPVTVTVRVMDAFGNVTRTSSDRLTAGLEGASANTTPYGATLARGIATLELPAPTADGVARVAVTIPSLGLAAVSNPIVVGAKAAAGGNLYWGDTQAQTGETVGAGSLDDFFDYARDAARLDFVTHSANDFQVTKDFYSEVLEETSRRTEPGAFLAFAGFEWSGNTPMGGDHNVLYADNDDAPLHRSSHALVEDRDDLDTDRITVTELNGTLRDEGIDAITVPHVGGRLAKVDLLEPDLSPVLEIVSVHGWFEWFGIEALRAGHRVGFVGASDDHTGRPGGSYPTRPEFGVRNGLAAVYAEELTKPAILRALRARHAYATTGERMSVKVTSGPFMMGDAFTHRGAPAIEITARGTAGIESVELLDIDRVVSTFRPVTTRSTRLRVSWKGARGRDRQRFQNWDGDLTVNGATIVTATEWAFDAVQHGITAVSDTGISWRSNTSGDSDGVILDLADVGDRAEVRFTAGGVDETFLISEIGDEPVVRSFTGGVERALTIEWLPAEPLDRDVVVNLTDPEPALGEHGYFVRIRQDDGHIAWASPMFVTVTD